MASGIVNVDIESPGIPLAATGVVKNPNVTVKRQINHKKKRSMDANIKDIKDSKQHRQFRKLLHKDMSHSIEDSVSAAYMDSQTEA